MSRHRLLIVEPMSSGAALMQAASEIDIEVVAASYDRDDRIISPALRRHVHRVVVVDTNDDDAVRRVALELHDESPLMGVVPGFEFYVDTVSRVAASLGLPGLAPENVDVVRHKGKMLDRVAAHGLRVPRYAAASSESELAAAAEHVRFPCVIKPIDSAGSVHVSRADTPEQVRAAYRRMVEDERRDLGRRPDGRVLLAEYLDGPEFSVEGYVLGSQVEISSITHKLLGPEPYFVELGHIVQAEVAPAARDQIEWYTREVVRALGVTLGPFHCELRLVDGEPVLIELAARLGGDHITELVTLVRGVSLPRVMLAAYTGLSHDAVGAVREPQAKCAGIRYFAAPAGLTRYQRASGLDDLRARPGVLAVELEVGPGQPFEPSEDFRGRLGHVIFIADSHADAVSLCNEVGEVVRFE